MSPPPPFLCSLTELLVKSSSFKLCDRFLFLLVNFFNICALSRWDRMSVFKQKAVSLCVVHIFGDSVKLIWVKTTTSSFTRSSLITLTSVFPSQPIVDLSPIKRSASSLTPQHHYQDVGLKDYDLERPSQAQSSGGMGQVQGQDRAHHHHHHHRCHRRRDKDKDKKQKSLDRAASVQPSSTVGEAFLLYD